MGVRLLVLGVSLASACQLASQSSSEPERALAGAISTQSLGTPARAAAPKPEPRTAPSAVPAAGCPENMAEIGAYCIDRYEAHLVVPASGGGFTPHPHYERPIGGARFVARSAHGVMPQAYISRVEAAAACENAGKRLCSLAEWRGACRGSARTIYPYGRKFEGGRCNVGKAHLLTRLFGANPRAWQYDAHFNAPALARVPGFLSPTGQFAGCASDYGVNDMVGNLHEWVSDRADLSLAQKLPLKPGIQRALGRSRGNGVFMGGFFSTTDEHGKGCDFVTAAHEPRYHDYSTGFRCCRDR